MGNRFDLNTTTGQRTARALAAAEAAAGAGDFADSAAILRTEVARLAALLTDIDVRAEKVLTAGEPVPLDFHRSLATEVSGARTRRGHEPGQCPSDYPEQCDGVESWQPNPFLLDVEDRYEYEWLCPGMAATIAVDI